MRRYAAAALLTAWLVTATVHAASSDSPEQALAAWVPPSILVGLVIVFGLMLWRSFAQRLDKMETTLEKIKELLPAFATNAAFDRIKEETRLSVRSLEDSFHTRLNALSGTIEVVKDRLTRRGDI